MNQYRKVNSQFQNVTPLTLDEFMREIKKPGILGRLERLPPEIQEPLVKELLHFQRAEEGHRMRPDLLPDGFSWKPAEPNIANKHGLAMPFSPRETHRPDHLASPEFMKHERDVTERINVESATEALCERMGTDADRPLPEPTLRDQLEAAYHVHTKE